MASMQRTMQRYSFILNLTSWISTCPPSYLGSSGTANDYFASLTKMLSSYSLNLISALVLPAISQPLAPKIIHESDLARASIPKRSDLEILRRLDERAVTNLGTFDLAYTAPPSDELMYSCPYDQHQGSSDDDTDQFPAQIQSIRKAPSG